MSRDRVWRFLQWVPAVVMTLAWVALLILFASGGLRRVSAWFLFQLIPPLLGLLFLVIGLLVVIVQRRRPRGRAAIATTVLALLSLLPVALPLLPIAYPASLATMEPSATVRLPADGPLRVAWGGDTRDGNYHVIAPDQRWAYDLVVEPYFMGSSDLDAYGCYGIPVLAPAEGEVVAAHDGEPDITPGSLPESPEVVTGNHVAIRLESGTYLIIAHLKPGTLRVSVGERVSEGQEIGQCGNSGNTSEPHIHIHHQRQDPNEAPIGFAEGLPLYFREHDGPPMPTGGFSIENGTPVAKGDVVQHTGR